MRTVTRASIEQLAAVEGGFTILYTTQFGTLIFDLVRVPGCWFLEVRCAAARRSSHSKHTGLAPPIPDLVMALLLPGL